MSKNSLRILHESKRAVVARIALTCIAVAFAGCAADATIAPAFKDPVRRNNSFMCVGPETNGAPRDTIPPYGDTCPLGYDIIPWY